MSEKSKTSTKQGPAVERVTGFRAWRAARWLRSPETYSGQDAQSPSTQIAAVLTCSDLPAPPETLFGLPPGSLFTVQCGSLQLTGATGEGLRQAVEGHGLPLIVVLGHEGCSLVEPLRAFVAMTRAEASDLATPPGGLSIGWILAHEVGRELLARGFVRDRVRAHDLLVLPATVSHDGATVRWAPRTLLS